MVQMTPEDLRKELKIEMKSDLKRLLKEQIKEVSNKTHFLLYPIPNKIDSHHSNSLLIFMNSNN